MKNTDNILNDNDLSTPPPTHHPSSQPKCSFWKEPERRRQREVTSALNQKRKQWREGIKIQLHRKWCDWTETEEWDHGDELRWDHTD